MSTKKNKPGKTLGKTFFFLNSDIFGFCCWLRFPVKKVMRKKTQNGILVILTLNAVLSFAVLRNLISILFFIFLWNVKEKKTFSFFFSVIFVLWNVCVPVVFRFCQSFSQQFELFLCFLFASLCKMNIYVRKFISACQFLLDNINDLCVCCRMGPLRRFVSESCRKVVDREWKIAPKNFSIWSLDAFSHSSYWILVGFCS